VAATRRVVVAIGTVVAVVFAWAADVVVSPMGNPVVTSVDPPPPHAGSRTDRVIAAATSALLSCIALHPRCTRTAPGRTTNVHRT